MTPDMNEVGEGEYSQHAALALGVLRLLVRSLWGLTQQCGHTKALTLNTAGGDFAPVLEL